MPSGLSTRVAEATTIGSSNPGERLRRFQQTTTQQQKENSNKKTTTPLTHHWPIILSFIILNNII